MSFWQDNDFRIDPWGEGYGTPVSFENDEEEDLDVEVDISVEGRGWASITPISESRNPDRLVFIDGRRRIDCLLVGRNENDVLYGAFGTIGVGAVEVFPNSTNAANYNAIEIQRVLSFSGDFKGEPSQNALIPCPVGSSSSIEYTLHKSLLKREADPQASKAQIQALMRRSETRLAQSLANELSDIDELIILDGNLFSRLEKVLGYVKTLRKQYLTGEKSSLLWNLKPGERTPIFTIGKEDRDLLWSWYIRSGTNDINYQRLGFHGLHGIIRLEMNVSGTPLEEAKRIADISTTLIPRFASHPARDPRAPQNLIPVGALEKELGRRMGDSKLIQRYINNFLQSG
ncbi:DNA double-strand break repair nuclease NurA [Nodosilinea sp. PGN35]|uniref:DNA double-strand break repair nuclease NurA n=1 Tax=Nodosilinea sp. PGN35 TaxID=3020489 RepID=UPI0023B23A0E|nr:DNA double-strand break repair nuclease NurA [Nodosilinea sp. TSF1-S3]MDF0367039.1 hypothetical protein [Nodosilinea sp. TSF1-S3]